MDPFPVAVYSAPMRTYAFGHCLKWFCLLMLMGHSTASVAVELSVAAESLSVKYQEQNVAGRTLNRERGDIAGLSLEAQWEMLPKIPMTLMASHHRGDIVYSGETQTGTPLSTQTDTRFFELGAWIEFPLYEADVDLAIQPELRIRQWDRDIQATASTVSLETRYRWWMPGLTLRADYQLTDGQRFSATAGIFNSTNIRARVDLNAIGLGKTTLEPESDTGQRFSLSWFVPLSDGQELFLSFHFERLAFQASEPVLLQSNTALFSVSEPESNSWHRRLGFGFRF